MDRPILFAANSSWYLWHYRKLLIDTVSKSYDTITLSPIDSSAKKLGSISLHFPWRISRKADSNPLKLVISLLKAVLLIRALKPRLIHSHTIKVNLICSIAAIFIDVPCVYSFAGLGRVINNKGIKGLLFKYTIKLILLLSTLKRKRKFKIVQSFSSVAIVCQNPKDLQYLSDLYPSKCNHFYNLIRGSGVPDHYIGKYSENNKWIHCSEESFDLIESKLPKQTTFIFCARLLRSKGIYTFIDLAKLLPSSSFHIYGAIDASSKDGLNFQALSKELSNLANVKYFGNTAAPLKKYTDEYAILVTPSTYGEGLPRAIAEAQALKIPVITNSSSHGNNFDLQSLFVVTGSNAVDYCEAYKQILLSYYENKLSQKLNAGELFVKTKLSEAVVVDQTMDLYGLLLKANSNSYYLDRDKTRLDEDIAT